MIDICMALDQSVSPHTGVRTIQNTGVFWQAVFQPPRPYSLFLEHGSAAKTLISHPHNTASYAGYVFQGSLLLIVMMIKGSKKRNCEGDFWASEVACFWKTQWPTATEYILRNGLPNKTINVIIHCLNHKSYLHFTHKRDFYSPEQTRSWVYLKGSSVPT